MITSKIINRYGAWVDQIHCLGAIGQRRRQEDEGFMIWEYGGGVYKPRGSSKKDGGVIFAWFWYVRRGDETMSFTLSLRGSRNHRLIIGCYKKDLVKMIKNAWRTKKKCVLKEGNNNKHVISFGCGRVTFIPFLKVRISQNAFLIAFVKSLSRPWETRWTK